MAEEPRQYWVRNDKGKVWGPLTFASVELLVGNGMITGKLQASRDGLSFVYPGRLPDLREAFPQELWGDTSEPLDEPVDAPAPAGAAPGVPARLGRPAAPPPGGPPVLRSGPPVIKPGGSSPAPAPGKPPVVGGPAPAASSKPAPAPAAVGAPIPEKGDLAEQSPFHLYYRIAAAQKTAKLTLTAAESSYEIFFKKGAPEAVRSSKADEDLGAFLVSKGLLSQEKLADARKVAEGSGGDIINGLFGLQLLAPNDAVRYIAEHAGGLLARALALSKGSFALDSAASPPATAMPLGDKWALVCDAARALPAVSIRGRLGPQMDMAVVKSGGLVDVAQLKLTPQEARALANFDGVRSLTAMCAALPAEADAMARVAFLLSHFEALAFAPIRGGGAARPAKPAEPPAAAAKSAPAAAPEPPKIAAKPAPAAAPEPPKIAARPAPAAAISPEPPKIAAKPAPAPAAAAPGAPSAAKPAAAPNGKTPTAKPAGPIPLGKTPTGKPLPSPLPRTPTGKPAPIGRTPTAPPLPELPGDDPAKLKTFVEGLKGKNHYEVLGVKQEAPVDQIKAAYFQLAKAFHPDTVPSGAAPEVGQLKASVFGMLSEAYRVLGDDKLRANYIEELKAGSSEQVDAMGILAAEESFQKGCILVKARKYEDAVKMLGEAIKLYDKEGEYYAWYGWARFLVAKDKGGAKLDAMRDIEKAMKLNARCAPAPYFAGQVAKLTGDAAGALKWFKKTVELDPNHIDAQREIRMAKK